MTLRDKLKFWILLSSYVEMIVRGTSPLSLPNAIADSLEYLKAFGGTKQRNLPDGYTELEYIESTGTQYLDLGKISSNDIIDAKFEWTQVSNNYLLGSLEDGSNWQAGKMLGITYYTGNNRAFYNRGTTTASTGGAATFFSITANTEYTIHWQPSSNQITVNGTQYTGGADNNNQTTDVFETANNLYLFCANRGGVAGNFDYVKMREFSIAGKRNLIPARRNSDNVLGMYDTVSQTFFTNAGTGTFTAGGEAVPTPDTPMDIISNNGALKARHQSGLPWGYTLLEYIESTGAQCIDTGLAGSITGNRYKIGFTRTGVSGGSAKGIIGTHNSTTPYDRSYIATVGNQWEFGYGSAPRDGTVVNDTYYDIELDTTNSKYLFKANGVVVRDDSFVGDRATANILIGTVYQISSTYCSIGKYHYAKIYDTDGTTLLMNLVPAKNSSNVVGMYDTVTQTFFANAGTGDFTAGNPVSDPVEIYTDGTVETINVHGKNLFDISTATPSMGINAFTGEMSSAANVVSASDYIPVSGGKNYTLNTQSWSTNPSGVAWYNANKEYISGQVYTGSAAQTFTAPANAYYARITVRTDQNPYQFERGSTATTYQPYFDGGTATAEMLLKVGDYEDVQEILSGTITRNVGVMALDGSEGWGTSGDRYQFKVDDAVNTAYRIVVTHGQYSGSTIQNTNYWALKNNRNIVCYADRNRWATIDDWKSWLADQYAAGTPVIIVYPRATPTTESVAGQALQVQQGDNVVEITQAAIDGLELEAKFKKQA